MREDTSRIIDMLESIERIQKYSKLGKLSFLKDELIQTYIVYNLQVLCEAASNLTNEFKSKHSNIEWHRIIGTRNILVHKYFKLDYDLIWAVCEETLPYLYLDLQQIVSRKEE